MYMFTPSVASLGRHWDPLSCSSSSSSTRTLAPSENPSRLKPSVTPPIRIARMSGTCRWTRHQLYTHERIFSAITVRILQY